MGSPEALAEVDQIIDNMRGMIGMKDVADQLETMVEGQRELLSRKKAGLVPRKRVYNHMLMTGPPGTGKTTAADDIATAFSLLGITGSPDIWKTHPSDLVGNAVGDAETNTMEAIKRANQGVLFIDEAHQFANSEFGKNAIKTLMAPMADKNNKLVVIMAGYGPDMDRTLKLDPGLKGRFPLDLKFKAFGWEDLSDIVLQNIGRDGQTFNTKTEHAIEEAMQMVTSYPDHASIRDAEIMTRYANDARRMRVKGLAQDDPKRHAFVEADWKIAMKRFAKWKETED